MVWLPLVLGEGEGGPPALMQFVPIIFFLVVMMIFMGRSSARQRRETQNMLANLKKNDKVITSAGIIGIVDSIKENEDEVVLKVDETTNSRIKVLKSTIVRITSKEAQLAQTMDNK